jgi:hypothetical protein
MGTRARSPRRAPGFCAASPVRAGVAKWHASPSSYDWNATHARRRGGVAERFNSEPWPTTAVVRRLFGGWPGVRAAAGRGRADATGAFRRPQSE